ncbi:hypothetical protein [Zavarzinella formosa]|uniref:hypothetical protein n=1 Tax=Zavarzinella formosa TaxID=360055 RepID=UPI0003791443|nr:hypothetical protein [Zavarzinella formosa]
MDMAELAKRTGLPVRKLRYISDHRVLPGLRGIQAGHGVARTFTNLEGFAIALAARLLDSGLSRKLVTSALAAACRPGGPPETTPVPHLSRVFHMSAGRLEIGDAKYARVHAPRDRSIGGVFDTRWMSLSSVLATRDDYTPTVLVAVELDELARAVQARHPDRLE